jgi:hypothetical protein
MALLFLNTIKYTVAMIINQLPDSSSVSFSPSLLLSLSVSGHFLQTG